MTTMLASPSRPLALRRREAADHIGSSHTTVAITGSPTQPNLHSASFSILGASQNRTSSDRRE